jgi:hypothetical protein
MGTGPKTARSRCGDLNPKPADYKSAALPLSYTGPRCGAPPGDCYARRRGLSQEIVAIRGAPWWSSASGYARGRVVARAWREGFPGAIMRTFACSERRPLAPCGGHYKTKARHAAPPPYKTARRRESKARSITAQTSARHFQPSSRRAALTVCRCQACRCSPRVCLDPPPSQPRCRPPSRRRHQKPEWSQCRCPWSNTCG